MDTGASLGGTISIDSVPAQVIATPVQLSDSGPPSSSASSISSGTARITVLPDERVGDLAVVQGAPQAIGAQQQRIAVAQGDRPADLDRRRDVGADAVEDAIAFGMILRVFGADQAGLRQVVHARMIDRSVRDAPPRIMYRRESPTCAQMATPCCTMQATSVVRGASGRLCSAR